MRPLILFALVLCLTGCQTSCTEDPRANQGGPPSFTPTLPSKTAEQTKIESLQKQLTDAEKEEAQAAAEGKTTTRLVAENKQLQLRTQIAEEQKVQLDQYLDSLARQKKDSDKAVEASRVSDWQWRLYYVAIALAAIGVIAFIVKCLYPIVAAVAGWAWKIFAALAVVVTVVAKLLPKIVWFIDFLPYLLWPIGAIIALYLFAVFRQWWLSHHSTNQLLQAVGSLVSKGVVSATAMEQHLANELDSPILTHVQKVGQRLATATQTAVLTVRQITDTPASTTEPPAPPAAGPPA